MGTVALLAVLAAEEKVRTAQDWAAIVGGLLALLVWPVIIGLLVYLWIRKQRTVAEAPARGYRYTDHAAPRSTPSVYPFTEVADCAGGRLLDKALPSGRTLVSGYWMWTDTHYVDGKRQSMRVNEMFHAMWIGGSIPTFEVLPERDGLVRFNDPAMDSLMFDDQYRIRGELDTARTFLDPRMMEFLTAWRDKIGGFTVADGWLVTHRNDSLDQLAAADEAAEYLDGIAARIPRVLVRQYAVPEPDGSSSLERMFNLTRPKPLSGTDLAFRWLLNGTSRSTSPAPTPPHRDA